MSIGKYKKTYRSKGLALLAALMVVSVPARSATLQLSTSVSDDGSFEVGFHSNTRYFVDIIDVSDDGNTSVLRHFSGRQESGSIELDRDNGVYQFQLRVCDRYTNDIPGNCSSGAAQSVTVNITNYSQIISYEYDALGRLVKSSDSEKDVVYCYDDAGNRTSVNSASQNLDSDEVCSQGVPDEPVVSAPPEPTGLDSSSAPSGGTNIFWGPSAGADRYEIWLSINETVTVYGESTLYTTIYQGAPIWMRACNSGGCSSQVHFDGGPPPSSSSSSSSSQGGSSSSSSSAPSLDTPTGLSLSSGPYGSINAHWNPVDGASSYTIGLGNGSTVQAVSGQLHQNITGGHPIWIEACNSDVCSDRGYFQ